MAFTLSMLFPVASLLLSVQASCGGPNEQSQPGTILPTATTPPDNTQPVGTNPIKIASAEHLGYQLANNSCSHRDLGFTGKLGENWYALFGDTLWCDQGVKEPESDTDGFHGMVRDAVSLLMSDPLSVVDLHLNDDAPVPHQLQFVPFNPAWNETNTYGFGGTSLCETDASTGDGVLYYLVVSPHDGGQRQKRNSHLYVVLCLTSRLVKESARQRPHRRRRGQG
jgi:hypothetical protein